eukprot:TRINITY_DN17828_c0_g1_i1.p1 TRINITY_DN17828_c0_g1~~TRINITY_DN17828_c0_g1_i1.p1  ORF type:complete len:1008 (+),score=160.29 TRINITY_DN17828_c0_g1_i1:47-3025(+)
MDVASLEAEMETEVTEIPPKQGCLSECFAAKMELYASRPCLGWRVGEDSHFMSCNSFFKRSRQLSLALAARVPAESMVGIIGANSLAWFTVDFACLWAGLATVPLSDTWDPNTLQLVLDKCRVTAVFCDVEHLLKLQGLNQPPWLVCMDAGFSADKQQGSASGKAPEALDDLLAASWQDSPIVSRAPEAIHTILHTSGTTGMPKGVVYTDSLWLNNMVSYPGLNVGYSYMPLAFITDRHTVCTAIWNGGRVGIRTPGSIDEIFKDLKYLRPTVMKGVPTFFERVQNAAQIVHDKSLELLGGRCRILICGAGALDESVANWFRSCEIEGKNVMFLEMYGGTECGNIAVNRQLQPYVEYKLLPYGDLPEGYGELVVKTGAAMFAGYYQEPEKTADAFTDDGFYKIGDLVHIDNGRIDVIGRAKTSIKLGNGKWVFAESLEDLYRSKLKAIGVQHVYIHGDSQHDALVAVISAEKGVDVADLLPKLHAVAAEAGKQSYERISAIIPASEPFSMEAGTLNGTGKLDRRNLLKLCRTDIDAELQRLAAEAANAALQSLDSDKSFASQGGTSLQASRIAGLYLELGLPVSRVAKLLLSDQPLKTVKEELERADPLEDAKLERLTPVKTGDVASEGRVFLTGATGFVGRFILAELLARGRTVLCLVRANNETAGKKRLQKALVEIGRWHDSWWSRLQVMFGGLSAEMDLSSQRDPPIRVVIHSAAVVNLKGSYEFHRSANVLGTIRMLQFAAKLGAHFIFLSTTDTYRTKDEAMACEMEPSREVLLDTKHGYAASKAVGESLVAAAAREGLRACNVRLGMVAGDTRTGYCAPTDFAMRLIIGFAHTHSFPMTDAKHTVVHSLPVDVAAAALVDIADSSMVGAVNLVSGAPLQKMSDLREQLQRFNSSIFGELPVVPFPEWMQHVKSEAQLSAWPVMGWAFSHEEFPVFNTRLPPLKADWATPATLGRLRQGLDETCLHRMLRYTFITDRVSKDSLPNLW